MLPVKWMPPEAFLDGIFTAKVKRSFLNDKDPFSLWCLCCLLLVQSLFLGGPTPYGVEYNFSMVELFSSPRAKRAESAGAFTGRRNSYSGRGEDFLSRQPNFFTETAVNPERKVEKWFPRWEINRHAEG